MFQSAGYGWRRGIMKDLNLKILNLLSQLVEQHPDKDLDYLIGLLKGNKSAKFCQKSLEIRIELLNLKEE
jgi:hypothetical protein